MTEVEVENEVMTGAGLFWLVVPELFWSVVFPEVIWVEVRST